MYLYHYFDKTTGPFRNLSDLPAEEAKAMMQMIKDTKPHVQCAKRQPSYVEDRLQYEEVLAKEFAPKGGLIKRKAPHYMVVEHSPWLATWFDNSGSLRIDMNEFDVRTVSFTYGDSHPVFSPRVNKMDGKEYRRKLYTYEEILGLIAKYGLPQDWNNDGAHGPERYIEAHIWSDDVIEPYRNRNRTHEETGAPHD